MISRDIIDEIVYRNDIEQVIGSYVTLKRAGSNMNGLCPFHNEKTPSFTVFPATKSFYCFGCGAGGDVISFIMREENLDYVDALEFLAARAGITIPHDNEPPDEHGIPRKRVYEMNLAAARFFRECLSDEKYGKEAMSYLTEKRQLSMATIRHFGLGCSPDSGWALTNHMKRLGFSDEELSAGFLCGIGKNSGKPYDYFRNRVIFPIIDTTGNVVAFGGRVLDDSKPKYLNTSDTPAFKKSKHLFALNFARRCCSERMILCEGYMDVIALHAAGFENAVATLGTAITSEQARIFAKYTKQVVICYDSDNAGQTAAQKAIRLLGEVGVDVRVLKLEGAKDPDEYIKKFGADAFRRALEGGISGFDFKLGSIISQYNLALAEDVIKASGAVCSMIAAMPSQVERDIGIRKASEILRVSPEAMQNDVEHARRRMRSAEKKRESEEAQRSIRSFGDRVNTDAAKNIRASRAEETLLGLMLIYDEFRAEAASGAVGLSADDFVTSLGRRIFEALCELERSERGFSKAMLGEYFNIDELGRIEKIEQERRALARNDKEVFLASIDSLKKESGKSEGNSSDPFADLRRMQALHKQAKEKKNV
ncbi:MAG: DNA primase [Clostridia bacterium]|nr:DNA primase [Clostridia bacterium]